MNKIKTSSHLRSVLKGISWRVIATTDTIFIVLLITCLMNTCSLENAIKIGVSEFILKLVIYYIHERIWLKYLRKEARTKKELILKSITWRLTATTLTFIISGIILNAFDEIAILIALTELFTKLILYYVHELIWLKLPLGRLRKLFIKKKV